MTNFLNAFLRDESGAAAAEYALILAIVGAGIAGAAVYLGDKVGDAIYGAGDTICAGDSAAMCALGADN